MNRRHWGCAFLSAGAVLAATEDARAQAAAAYPSKPIRIIVALAPGGGVDTAARFIAQRLSEQWGQQVIAENRPGAGGTIAAEAVARAAPDGYTLLMNSTGHVVSPSLYKLPYDVLRDFTPITLVVLSPSVFAAHPSVPVKSVKDVIALAKARPDQLLFSSSGTGGTQHLALELFNQMAGVRILHVPYKGTAPSMTDLVGGRVSLSMASVVSTMPHVRSGRLRALAVISGKRSIAVPELPTIAESGVPGYAVDTWYGAFAPGGTPREIVLKLQQEMSRGVAQPEVKEKLLAVGLEPVGNPQDQFAAYVKAEYEKWGQLVRAVKMTAE
jgi:tripartite-type tricarboxylate transporter receptor subunit TctC